MAARTLNVWIFTKEGNAYIGNYPINLESYAQDSVLKNVKNVIFQNTGWVQCGATASWCLGTTSSIFFNDSDLQLDDRGTYHLIDNAMFSNSGDAIFSIVDSSGNSVDPQTQLDNYFAKNASGSSDMNANLILRSTVRKKVDIWVFNKSDGNAYRASYTPDTSKSIYSRSNCFRC